MVRLLVQIPTSRSKHGPGVAGTTTQGVFRVSGSNKRIKELEQIFDSRPRYLCRLNGRFLHADLPAPSSYGKNLTWDSFSVHDAASVFRRYLNMLPVRLFRNPD